MYLNQILLLRTVGGEIVIPSPQTLQIQAYYFTLSNLCYYFIVFDFRSSMFSSSLFFSSSAALSFSLVLLSTVTGSSFKGVQKSVATAVTFQGTGVEFGWLSAKVGAEVVLEVWMKLVTFMLILEFMLQLMSPQKEIRTSLDLASKFQSDPAKDLNYVLNYSELVFSSLLASSSLLFLIQESQGLLELSLVELAIIEGGLLCLYCFQGQLLYLERDLEQGLDFDLLLLYFWLYLSLQQQLTSEQEASLEERLRLRSLLEYLEQFDYFSGYGLDQGENLERYQARVGSLNLWVLSPTEFMKCWPFTVTEEGSC